MTPPPDCLPAPDASIDVLDIGAERSPLIRIDGATTRPAELVRYAAMSTEFACVEGNLYPGLRAPMPLDFVKAMVMRLDPLIRSVYALDRVTLAHAECFFSIVTTPADRLVPYQTIPHIDTSDPFHFATVQYLCCEDFGGTAFFRQDATGFECITPDRADAWGVARDRCLAVGGPAAYPSPATPGYTCVAQTAARFDRLILYRSNALHAGIIDPAIHHPPEIGQGRLTATMFIRYRR